VFASGGIEVHAFGIDEIRTLQGDLIYNHDRDEPPRKQIFDRKVIETLNLMLQGVVTMGTGKRAQLDYTYSAGKTGTSTAYRDAWFVGYTGQYVAGVWLGNDDFTPMARVTGGSFPAETWHNFMVQAHDTDNIPLIPGLPLHPNQVAEQERIAATTSQNFNSEIPAPPPESVKDMSAATRQVLEKLGGLLKDAPRLTPNEAAPPPHRAEAPSTEPAGSPATPSLASAANGDSAPDPDAASAPAGSQSSTTAGAESATAPPPH
jgi:penicillin-binding protein 1A